MSTFKLHRLFTNHETLRSIAKEHLRALLCERQAALAAEGFTLPDDPDGEVDYDRLASLLMTPEKLPAELREAFFFIQEMSTAGVMECLLEAAEQAGLEITGTPAPSPADVAVQIWLKEPELLERKHAEQFLYSSRTFECLHAVAAEIPDCRKLTPAVTGAMTDDLNDWLDKRKRGRSARVFYYERPDGLWFLVRHGDPFRREGAINEKGESEGVYYWPEKFDVLVLDPVEGELRMNARTKGEKKLYRQVFGRHLYGDEDFFGGEDKYTLEPLRQKGADALAFHDIEGIEEILLTEIHFFRGGSFREREIRKADDIFAAYSARQAMFPIRPAIVKASFRVTFSDSQTPRTVIIKAPNVAQYTRDGDSVIIEKWLRLRGFIRTEGGSYYEPAVEEVLVSA